MIKPFYLLLIALLGMLAADDPYAAQLFQKHCATCHDSAVGGARAMFRRCGLQDDDPRCDSAERSKSGVMKTQAAPLSADERLKIASCFGTAVTTERRREEIANPCAGGAAPVAASRARQRLGPVGAAVRPTLDSRMPRPRAFRRRISALETEVGVCVSPTPRPCVPSLPFIAAGCLSAARTAAVYALDAATGCVPWSTDVQSQSALPGSPSVRWGQARRFLRRLRRVYLCARRRPVSSCGRCALTNIPHPP